MKFYEEGDIRWSGIEGGEPDWNGPARSLMATVFDDVDVCLIFHAEDRDRSFVLPPCREGRRWRLAVDTAREEGRDICGEGSEEPVSDGHYLVTNRSMVILVGK